MEMEISNGKPYKDGRDSSILSSLDEKYITEFKPFIERYFSKQYCTEFNTPDQQYDTCVRIHNNGLYLVFLSDNHSIIKENKTVKNINFKISKSIDRTKNKFSGKHKKGAQLIKSDAVLCYIECEDGSLYPVYGGVRGRLLELNDKLLENPGLVIKNNNSCGYICIIQPEHKVFYNNDSNIK